MAEVVRMIARRRFWLTPKRRLTSGEAFHDSPGLAERLARRGDEAPEPERVRPTRKRKQAPA
jgi:hypothetical protein